MIDIKTLDVLCPVGTMHYFSPENNPNKYAGKWKLLWKGLMETSEKFANGEPIPYYYNDKNDKKIKVAVCLWKRTA